jgi:hypothetical protein
MPISAQSILAQVARDLNDETSVRWTTRDLVAYFNDGQRDILTHRPDARNVSVALTLVAGVKQALPSNGEKLIDVTHNDTGAKTAITPVDRRMLDSQVRGWRGLPGQVEILHYCYDELEPKAFDVYPPAAITGARVAIEYAATAQDIPTPALGTTTATITGDLGLSDLFANAIRNYVMFRAYSKQTEYTANPNLAVAFYTAYTNDLGVEARGTTAISPNNGAAQ